MMGGGQGKAEQAATLRMETRVTLVREWVDSGSPCERVLCVRECKV
jgi:hypothetical protein